MNRRVLLSGVAGIAALLAGGYYAWRESGRRAQGALAALISAAPAQTRESAMPHSVGGDDIYAVTLPDLEGRPQALSRYRGKPLLINFWATWCAPCVQEMPELAQLDQRYPQVQFLGIGIDTAANMREFVAKIPVSYPLVVAGHAGIDLVRALGNAPGGLPFTVLFDADGRVHHRVLGKIDPQALDRFLLTHYAAPV